jgi:hypothetical protein
LIDTSTPIGADEMRALEQLHARLPALRKIPFAEVLTTPYLITPLRRTLEAQKRAAASFELSPPPAPAVTGNAQTSSSSNARAAGSIRPHRPHAWDERR